jgi:hypothetical protein
MKIYDRKNMSISEFEKKTYLGDGVYSEFDGYQIKLTVENGMSCPTDTIYLEPEVVSNLISHINRIAVYRGLKKAEPSDLSFISPDEMERCLHSDPNDAGREK